MRKLIIAAVGAAAMLIPAVSASAQGYYQGRGGYYGHGRNDVAREIRECRRELRHADSRREYRRELRECRREINRAQRRGNNWGYYGRGNRRGW